MGVEPSTGTWPTYQGPHGAISLKKTSSPTSSNPQLSRAPQLGVGCHDPSLFRVGMVSHSCCEFMTVLCYPGNTALSDLWPLQSFFFFLSVPWALGEETVIQMSLCCQSAPKTLAICSLIRCELSLLLMLTLDQNSQGLHTFILDYIIPQVISLALVSSKLHNITRLISLSHNWTSTISHSQNSL